ncbi:OmpA family protein [Novilysobacter ciconiae]|nr:OmpA family protein [Lysobacter ciconiae]
MVIRNMLRGALATAVCALLSVPAGALAQDVGLPSTAVMPVQGVVGDTDFPEASRSRIRNGDFVNVDNLRQMGRGLGKSQVRRLLGNPHFSEGVAGVSRWDYVFNFRTGVDTHVTCQYQVNYERANGNYVVDSMHWDGSACLDALNDRPDPVVGPDPVVSTAAPAVHTLSADALFAFDGSRPRDILPQGKEEIAALAQELSRSGAEQITVVGHADRLGSHSYNQALSERRAATVRQLLVEQGLPGAGITAAGRGSSEPVTSCDRSLPRAELIECLKPDRRVEIRVAGTH